MGGCWYSSGGGQLCPAHVTRKPKALAMGARLGAAGHRQAPEQRAFEQCMRLPRVLGPADPPGNAEAGSFCGLSGPMWRWNSWPWSPPAGLGAGDTSPHHKNTSWPGPGSHVPSTDLALVARTPGSGGGVVWPPHPPLLWAPCLPGETLFTPEHTGILPTQEDFEGPGGPVRAPQPELAAHGIHGAPGEDVLPSVCSPNPCFPSAPTPPAHKAQCLIPGSQASHSL